MKNAFSEERNASTSFLEEERERTLGTRLVTRNRPFSELSQASVSE